MATKKVDLHNISSDPAEAARQIQVLLAQGYKIAPEIKGEVAKIVQVAEAQHVAGLGLGGLAAGSGALESLLADAATSGMGSLQLIQKALSTGAITGTEAAQAALDAGAITADEMAEATSYYESIASGTTARAAAKGSVIGQKITAFALSHPKTALLIPATTAGAGIAVAKSRGKKAGPAPLPATRAQANAANAAVPTGWERPDWVTKLIEGSGLQEGSAGQDIYAELQNTVEGVRAQGGTNPAAAWAAAVVLAGGGKERQYLSSVYGITLGMETANVTMSRGSTGVVHEGRPSVWTGTEAVAENKTILQGVLDLSSMSSEQITALQKRLAAAAPGLGLPDGLNFGGVDITGAPDRKTMAVYSQVLEAANRQHRTPDEVLADASAKSRKLMDVGFVPTAYVAPAQVFTDPAKQQEDIRQAFIQETGAAPTPKQLAQFSAIYRRYEEKNNATAATKAQYENTAENAKRLYQYETAAYKTQGGTVPAAPKLPAPPTLTSYDPAAEITNQQYNSETGIEYRGMSAGLSILDFLRSG